MQFWMKGRVTKPDGRDAVIDRTLDVPADDHEPVVALAALRALRSRRDGGKPFIGDGIEVGASGVRYEWVVEQDDYGWRLDRLSDSKTMARDAWLQNDTSVRIAESTTITGSMTNPHRVALYAHPSGYAVCFESTLYAGDRWGTHRYSTLIDAAHKFAALCEAQGAADARCPSPPKWAPTLCRKPAQT